MVGMHAVSIASAAYYASLEYARERRQGRPIGNKDMDLPQIPIIEHADVKRMLLFQKSIIEGSLSLLIQAAKYEDLAHIGDEADRKKYALLLDLLTPIAKTYPSEMGILTTSAAIQIHGGYGYTRDFPVEKYFREIRIHTLHEGTTAIQGMDLMGRKIAMQGGQAVLFLIQEVLADIGAARQYNSLTGQADILAAKLQELQQLTMELMAVAQKEGAEAFLADATLYLELFSIITVGWQWLKMGTVAEQEMAGADESYKAFLRSNLMTGQFFYEYELPKTAALVQRLRSENRITVMAGDDVFM
jgi:butyryl-CoA dehydrogenase